MTGKVYLVGAGPGDPELITVKGLRCIREADTILYDRLINKQLLDYAKKDADLIYCGKLPHYHAIKQENIQKFLIKHAQKGKVVTRLKGGDPFVFGRGGEEAEALAKSGIEFEVVPGISSGNAAAAYAGIPLTHRNLGSSFACITGHRKDEMAEDDARWDLLAKGVDTIAIYMGVGNLAWIRERLLKHGRDGSTPAALIEKGTTREQRTVVCELSNIVEEARRTKINNPAMIIIGNVVKIREKIEWFDAKNAVQALSEAF